MKKLSIGILVSSLLLSGCAGLPRQLHSHGEKSEKVLFNFDIRVDKDKYDSQIRTVLSYSELFPDHMQRRFNNLKGRVILYDGPLTDLEEFSDLRGVQAFGKVKTYDSVPGLASIKNNAIAINLESDKIYFKNNNLVLHELCHGIIKTSYPQKDELSYMEHEVLATECARYYGDL